jgi:hypothetical protein
MSSLLLMTAPFVIAGSARAAGEGCLGCPASPPASYHVPCITWAESATGCFRPDVEEKEVPCPIEVLTPREIVHQTKCPSFDVDYREEKRVRCDLEAKTHEIEKIVPCLKVIPVKVMDPCTGCYHTEFKGFPTVEKVKHTVEILVPTQVEFAVRCPVLVPSELTITHRQIVVDCSTEMTNRKAYVPVKVPFEVRKDVPFWPEHECHE